MTVQVARQEVGHPPAQCAPAPNPSDTLTSASRLATATAAPKGDAALACDKLSPGTAQAYWADAHNLRPAHEPFHNNLPPRRSHRCLAKALLTQPRTHAGSRAARRQNRCASSDPRWQRCVIADCSAHTAPTVTALTGAPLEQRTYQRARPPRSQRPTQESSGIENAPSHAPRPAAKPDTELGEGSVQTQPAAESAISPCGGRKRQKQHSASRVLRARRAPHRQTDEGLLAPPPPTFPRL